LFNAQPDSDFQMAKREGVPSKAVAGEALLVEPQAFLVYYLLSIFEAVALPAVW